MPKKWGEPYPPADIDIPGVSLVPGDTLIFLPSLASVAWTPTNSSSILDFLKISIASSADSAVGNFFFPANTSMSKTFSGSTYFAPVIVYLILLPIWTGEKWDILEIALGKILSIPLTIATLPAKPTFETAHPPIISPIVAATALLGSSRT